MQGKVSCQSNGNDTAMKRPTQPPTKDRPIRATWQLLHHRASTDFSGWPFLWPWSRHAISWLSRCAVFQFFSNFKSILYPFPVLNVVNYARCPQGRPCLKLGLVSLSLSYFFFFVVASNLHINLFIKLCSLLEGIYCSDCLQQKRPNQNLFSARISRGRGPPHPYLCDVKSSFDLFIKPGLNFSLSLWRPYCVHVLDSSIPFSKRKLTLLKR